MKKSILIWIMILAIFAAGCAKTGSNVPQTSAATTVATTAPADTETTAPETTAPENTETEPTESEQTEPEPTEPADTTGDDSLDDYLTALKEQSDLLKASLQQEELTQAELNRISQELYELWDDALNDLWGKLRDSLPEEEFDKLLDEQLTWIETKESAVEAAGKDYEGGSIYSMIVNGEAARITEDRVYELFELLK